MVGFVLVFVDFYRYMEVRVFLTSLHVYMYGRYVRHSVAVCGRFHGYVGHYKIVTCSPFVRSACLRSDLSSLPVSLTPFGLWVLRIDDINIASTTGNKVGTSSSFKYNPGLPSSPGRGRSKFVLSRAISLAKLAA